MKIFMFLASKYLSTIHGYDRADLVQEQILACYNAIEKYSGEGKIGTFLFSVSENRLKAIYRFTTRQKRKPTQLMYLDGTRLSESRLVLADCSIDADQSFYIMELKQNTDLVAKEFLSKFEYYLYQQHIVNGIEISEIAIATGKTKPQVRNGMSRIRKKLREKRGLIVNDI